MNLRYNVELFHNKPTYELKDDISLYEGKLADYESRWGFNNLAQTASDMGDLYWRVHSDQTSNKMLVRIWDDQDKFLGIFVVEVIPHPEVRVVEITDEIKQKMERRSNEQQNKIWLCENGENK